MPAELARRENRLATLEAAMRRLEARAKAEAEAERQRRAEAEAERQRTGKRRRGKAPRFARRLARSRRWKSSTMKVERTTSAPSRAEVSVRRQTRSR